jgi:uncharacterized LabA/DUF88 family protein
MQKLHIFMDNSNLWIEGQRFASDPTGESEHKDASYRIDFGSMLKHVSNGREIAEARLYGSEPPPNDTVWEHAKVSGFKVRVFKRNFKNREKKVDTQMCVDITRAACTHLPTNRVLALVAGDSDYLPAVEEVLNRRWRAEVYFWSNASKEIRQNPMIHFEDLSPLLWTLGYRAMSLEQSTS